ncbi:hypothetical protein JQ594_12080 [Bradyrhizobium manausense]|uniref:hypothetical protein n=1 Tax=Bradyrhizobium manausense TaxID=989370 RepID=UPI001BA6A8D8|nr:hypothetical protein [Bradyrhizobium manausense]MBR0686658.1 hypothetical protein [Bradyrhizobium manausense]MBR0724875.1 hypothetical protein [Bradyrhizobium manausense]
MHFARFILSATLLLLTFGFVSPVHSQNNKPIVSGTFYEDRASSFISGNTLVLTFAQAPTNKFLNVTNVSCDVYVTNGQIINSMDLFVGTTPGQNDLGRIYSIKGSATSETLNTGKYYSIVTNQIYYKMGPGRYPSIEIGTVSNNLFSVSANCVIVGNLTDN